MSDDWEAQLTPTSVGDDWEKHLVPASGAVAPPPGPSMRDAIGNGLARAATFRLGDETVGAATAGAQGLANLLPRSLAQRLDVTQAPMGDAYRSARDDYRAQEAAAKTAHPDAFNRSEMAGDVGMMFAPGLGIAKGAKFLPTAAKLGAQGLVSGAGETEAPLLSRRGAFDMAINGGAGVLAAGGGTLLEKAGAGLGSRLLSMAGRKASAAEAKAAEIGARSAAEATQAARSAAGQDAQALYRALEHVEALKAEGSPEALARLRELEADGTIKSIKQQLLAKTVEELPSKLSKSQASRSAFREAATSEPARALEGATQAEQSSVRPDAWQLFKSYGEPILGAAAGSVLGDQLGHHGALGGTLGTAGGLLMGRTRAGKAIALRLARPGNQIAMANALRGLGAFAGGAGRIAGDVEGGVSKESLSAPLREYLLSRPSVMSAVNGEDQSSPVDSGALAILRNRKATP